MKRHACFFVILSLQRKASASDTCRDAAHHDHADPGEVMSILFLLSGYFCFTVTYFTPRRASSGPFYC